MILNFSGRRSVNAEHAYEIRQTHAYAIKNSNLFSSDSASTQDPLIGVSVVTGLLAVVWIVAFVVVRRRMITSNMKGTPSDV